MMEVKDGPRTLQFNGKLLAESTSERPDSLRWIEFKLYKTESGSYILSRVGVSLMFHGAACYLVKKYNLQETSTDNLHDEAVSCEECNPDESAVLVFPEKNRYWAQVSDKPDSVLIALYKQDQGGARYLTGVAQRLLNSASEVDTALAAVYNYEIIP
jgi:hypothetical protein|tara:strand:+ start:47 stop:517 length:471 start_codon:yes stop_codon:yes gene_type:complete